MVGHLRRRRPGGPGPRRRACAAEASAPATSSCSSCPNWVEAGITFWAAAYLGAVVVPVVHFYGAKEVGYILDATEPAVVVTADRFGYADHLAMYDGACSPTGPDPAGSSSATTPAADLPRRATAVRRPARRRPARRARSPSTPTRPAIIGFTSGTTSDPKGVVHSHRTIGFEARQLDHMFPTGGPPQITGAPVGPLHRDAQRLPRARCSASGR